METALSPVVAALVAAVAVSAGLNLGQRVEKRAATPLATFAVATVTAGSVYMLSSGPAPTSFVVWSAVMLAGLGALAVIDAATRTVPDALTVPMIGLGLIHAAMGPASFLPAVSAVVLVLAAGWLAALLLPGRLSRWAGDGDLFLLAGAVAWLGPLVLADLLVLAAVLLAGHAALAWSRTEPAALIVHERQVLPLAPALGIAQALVWFGGPLL